jgi:hypothetical protein
MTIALHAMARYWRRVAPPVLLWALLLGILLPGAARAADCGNGIKCLVVVGGAITRHAPVEALDWHGDWGMAASSADKDFVSQLLKLLQGRQGGRWAVHRDSAPGLDRNPAVYRIPEELSRLARSASVVVLQAGDDLDVREMPLTSFTRAYAVTAGLLRPAQGALLCVGTWWTNRQKDQAIKAACEQAGGVFVDLADVARVQANYARNERSIAHEGVGTHPGDAGMKAIALKLYQATERAPALRQPLY